jgi:16S rRNA (adenine1518-N6/adenine1519-N6)-dimethyltransferase
VRAAFDVTSIMRVGAGSFFPQPTVDSAVVLLVPRTDRVEETDVFRTLVRAAFQQRRKTLRNAWRSIADGEALARAATSVGISLDARGETLSVEQFAAMGRGLCEV